MRSPWRQIDRASAPSRAGLEAPRRPAPGDLGIPRCGPPSIRPPGWRQTTMPGRVMSNGNDKTSTTTDLELMLYADGELEGEALAAVEALLASDRIARQKVLALGVASAIVREEA